MSGHLSVSLKRKWVMQQHNDPKHTRHSTKEGLKKSKVNVLEWPNQSLDLNPIEVLWKDLKQAVHRRKPTNITQLKWFCTAKWANILQADVQDWSAVTRNFTCSYWCKMGSNQILKTKDHILWYVTLGPFWPCVYICVLFVWLGSLCLLSGLTWKTDDVVGAFMQKCRQF